MHHPESGKSAPAPWESKEQPQLAEELLRQAPKLNTKDKLPQLEAQCSAILPQIKHPMKGAQKFITSCQ